MAIQLMNVLLGSSGRLREVFVEVAGLVWSSEYTDARTYIARVAMSLKL
jgi:hypothetical protein